MAAASEMASALTDPPDDPVGRVGNLIDDPDGLLLGALLHDIGKVGAGNHVPAGARIAEAILVSMGYERHVRDLAGFMVAEHLLLPDTATRRDLTEENLILDVAARVDAGAPSSSHPARGRRRARDRPGGVDRVASDPDHRTVAR